MKLLNDVNTDVKTRNELLMYRAVVLTGTDSFISCICRTDAEARQWIDSVNNNYAYKSFIQRLDQNYMLLDSYYYTA